MSGYDSFARNLPTGYTQNFPGAGTDGAVSRPNNYEFATFFQDDWRVNPNFTLNLGVRYDFQRIAPPPIRNPSAVLTANNLDTSFKPSDKNNIAPRLGASYAINDKTVIRGGYGMFYGRTPAIVTGTAHTQNGIQVTGVSLTCTTTAANPCPVYPAIFAAQPTGLATVTPSLFLFSKDFKQPVVHQGRLAFEREILPNTSLTISYLLFRGDNLTRTRDVNLPQPVEVTGTFGGTTTTSFLRFPSATANGTQPLRPIPGFARIQLFESTANSFYQGLGVS